MATNKSIMTFADVFDLQMGKTPSRDISSYWSGDNVWVSIADMKDRKYVDSSKETISDEAIKATGIREVPEGTVFMSFKLSIGKVAIAAKNLYTNEAIMQFPIKPGYELSPEYLYYYLLGHKWQGANKAVMGATLNKKKIAQEHISFPSIEEQQRIVDELDLLTDIIDKKNAQFRDLDALAQSIFYEMFGDPIANEKGWPIYHFGELCNSELGKMLDSKRAFGTKKPYLCTINVLWDKIDLSTQKEMLIEEDELERYSVRKGDLLICEGGDIGRSAIWDREDEMYYQNSLHRIRFDETKMLPEVMLYIFKILKDRGELDQYGKGQTIKHLVKKTLLTIPVPVPDIQVQRYFAKKLASIKNDKSLVRQSLVSTQLLFESRMNKYFND